MNKAKFLPFSFVVFLILNGCSVTKSTKTSNGSWQLAWEENFSKPDFLDKTKWSVVERRKPDWANYMSDHKNVIHIKNGKLYLRGIKNPDRKKDTAKYLTGGLSSKEKFTFTYGKIEIRAKLENAQGAWPALWLLPNGNKYGAYPRNGEIDLMEHLNYDSKIYQTVHSYYTLELNEKTNPKNGAIVPVKPTQYNVYGLEWFPDKLVFTLNGKETFVYPKLDNVDKSQWPFDQPFYIILSMQLEGAWVGKANPDDLPVQMIIDWVKVYKPYN